ncbi:MAG: tetratricopeptide repeat protein, partial [Cyanobacteria bacterium J083]
VSLTGVSLKHLGEVNQQQGNFAIAEDYFQQAINLFEQVQNRPELAKTLNDLGKNAQLQGDQASALSYFQQALSNFQQLQDETGQAITSSYIEKLNNN